MKWGWRERLLLLVMVLLWQPTVWAEVVRGQAPIVSTVQEARESARKNALRDIVERAVGVHVSSKTETSLGMVVSDEITAKADGYVMINKIIREWQAEGYYFIELDATANERKIETAVQDLKGRLQIISDQETSRSGIQISVVERDVRGKYHFTASETIPYIADKLKSIGFNAIANDTVTEYLLYHASDPDAGLQARRLARDSMNRTEENALLRGVLATESINSRKDGMKEAVIKASFELIGLDSNSVDAFSHYFSAVAANAQEAERKARENAVREAVESLGKQALETVQSEMRGGVRQIKVTVTFSGMNNFSAQQQAVMSGLQAAGCRMLRTARASADTYRVFISTDSYSNLGELKAAIQANIPGLGEGIEDTKSLGSTKLSFSF